MSEPLTSFRRNLQFPVASQTICQITTSQGRNGRGKPNELGHGLLTVPPAVTEGLLLRAEGRPSVGRGARSGDRAPTRRPCPNSARQEPRPPTPLHRPGKRFSLSSRGPRGPAP